MVAKGEAFGHGTKMISFFDPSPDETNTEVRMTNGSTTLHYEADLSSLRSILVPAGTPDIVIDWIDNDALLENAMGGEWISTKITDVLVAHYLTRTPPDLVEEFLDLERIADGGMWGIFLSAGQRVNLARLTTGLDGASGDPFPGIDDVGTWIAALKCGSCSNPAPWFLSVIEPCQ
jgi:hypothetical protein